MEDIQKLQNKNAEVRARSTLPVKLKDKDKRHYFPIHLKQMFGFIPEMLIVEKVRGKNNTIVVRAIMTPEEIKKEDKLKAKLKPKIITK